MGKTAALILAAGKGTRMHSTLPKVLQTVLGKPMLGHIRAALRPVFHDALWTVIGHGADDVRSAFPTESRWILQGRQLGTGHALATALPILKADGVSRLLVINGDMPMLTTRLVSDIMRNSDGASLSIVSVLLPDPLAYGRIIRKDGAFAGIVEAKEYDEDIHGALTGEVNAGIYVMDLDVAERLLPKLSNANRGGEYYITDLAGLALAEGLRVSAVCCGEDPSLLGVNTPAELADAEERLRTLIVERLLNAGVRMHHPAQIVIGPDVTVQTGAELYGPCQLLGNTVVATGTVVYPFSHLVDATIGSDAVVGPYARLRPGTVVGDGAHVGNFVEMKKAVLGKGAKANHLTYLGDVTIGAGSNIGAGTITCNYDGKDKHRTVIGERAFIGSNTALVAPVNVGSDALVGAGSVITKDVPDNTLAVARGRQTNIPRR